MFVDPRPIELPIGLLLPYEPEFITIRCLGIHWTVKPANPLLKTYPEFFV
jgi:hypothetical protein